jgi:hypothetical protein
MKKIICVFSLLFLLCFFATPSFSSSCDQDTKSSHNGHGYAGHFGDIDSDDNDKVTWEEFKMHFAHGKKDVFTKIDQNTDGTIDHDEWHDFKEKHGYGHKD